jgi:hypothetical protein
MRSAQGAYPICPDNETTVAFVEFIHIHGTALLQAAKGAWAPRVYVSLMYGVRSHIARTGTTTRVFLPDNQSTKLQTAKHYLLGFTIKVLREHTFTDSTGGLEVLSPQVYQGHFH